MDPDLFYVFGPILVLAAITVTALGLRNPSFPSPALFRGGLALFLALVGLTVTWAVVQSRHEQKNRREKLAREKEGAPTPGTTTQAAAPAKAAPKVKGPGGTLQLAADKTQLAFDAKKLDSKPGKVTIDFTNPASIQHDVTIEKGSTQIAKSELIAAGKTSVSADLAPGSYVFFCSVPGHRQAGMEGTLTVK
jgi:plastocyanin